MKNCGNCRFARKTNEINMVGCAYWTLQYFKNNPNKDSHERDREVINSGLKEIYIGWMYPKRRYGQEKDLETFTSGTLLNGSIITHNEDYCSSYQTYN